MACRVLLFFVSVIAQSNASTPPDSPLIAAAAALDFDDVKTIAESARPPPLSDFIDAMAAACARKKRGGRKRSKRVAKIVDFLANGRYTSNEKGERARVALALEAAGTPVLVSESMELNIDTKRMSLNGVEHGVTPLHACAAGKHRAAVKRLLATVNKVNRWRGKKRRQSLGISKVYQQALMKRNAMRTVAKKAKNQLAAAGGTLAAWEESKEKEEEEKEKRPARDENEVVDLDAEGFAAASVQHPAKGGNEDAPKAAVSATEIPQSLSDDAKKVREAETRKLLDTVAASKKHKDVAGVASTTASEELNAARVAEQSEWARRPSQKTLVEWRTSEGYTALDIAVALIDSKIAKLLLNIGKADVDARDWDGWTALMKIAYITPALSGKRIPQAMDFIGVLADAAADGTLRAPVEDGFDGLTGGARSSADDDAAKRARQRARHDEDDEEGVDDPASRSASEGKTPRELAREACGTLLIDEHTGKLSRDTEPEREMCRNVDELLRFFEILGPAGSIKKMGDEQAEQREDDPDGEGEEQESTEEEKGIERKVVACLEANMKGEEVEGCDDESMKLAMETISRG